MRALMIWGGGGEGRIRVRVLLLGLSFLLRLD